ncbi:MAG: hypothetical protein HY273_07995 [Gammaproteobacteria bacterium]|nr:hypothetical protein [Gammaproteobacteria bacterium]
MMKLFYSVGILVSLLLTSLAGCSSAAKDASSNTVPMVRDVALSASEYPAHINATLTSSYRYVDTDGDSEGETVKIWLRDGQPIDGANNDNYTATAKDVGKKLKLRVTPAAATGKSPGTTVESPEITIENSPPGITGLVISGSVDGQAYAHVTLQASYSFHDLDGDGEDNSTYHWFYDGTPEPTPIGGANFQNYTIIDGDMGKAIFVQVTPKDSKSSVGATYTSSVVKVVNKAPVASNVRVNQAGDVLSITYDYTDQEGNVEAGSQFRWLRNGVAINATNFAYTLTLADAGKTITAEVTPLAEKGTSPGLPAISNPTKVATTNVELTVRAGLKQLHFSWLPVAKATRYRVLYNPDSVSGFIPLYATSDNITTTTYDWDIAVHRINWPNAKFMLEACDVTTCIPSVSISALNVMLDTIGYVKASNTGVLDQLGSSVALSADGNTLAVGAPGEDSAAAENPLDGCAPVNSFNCAKDSGAVYVYTRSGNLWFQQAYLKASNIDAYDHFGISVALSADGNTLAVGANQENSNTTGINSVPNVLAPAAGAVYVYTRIVNTWSQRAYVKASNTDTNDSFGTSIALSADGNTLAVGADQEDSGSTGVNSIPNLLAPAAGAVYVYARSGDIWLERDYVKASNTETNEHFGASIALSADGNTLAVGAWNENSAAVDSNQLDDCSAVSPVNCAAGSGAVYVYTRKGVYWTQRAYVKASNPGVNSRFGWSITLSADGNTLAVGADQEDSSSTGINSIPNLLADAAGAVYIYVNNGDAWLLQSYVKASNTETTDRFGTSVALSADGNMLAVGALAEDSAYKGIAYGVVNEATIGNGALGSGAVYVYTRTSSTWSQQAYVKASNTGFNDYFGYSITLSADGNTLAVGAQREDSISTGVNSSPNDSTPEADAGAVYLY